MDFVTKITNGVKDEKMKVLAEAEELERYYDDLADGMDMMMSKGGGGGGGGGAKKAKKVAAAVPKPNDGLLSEK